METATANTPVTKIARAIWEINKPARWIADKIGVGERYLRQLLADEKHAVPVQVANQVSSCAAVFTLPVTSDQPPVIVMSRKLVRSAASYSEVVQLLQLLDAEMTSASTREDFNLLALLHWQLVFVHHRAGSFLDASDKKAQRLEHISRAAEHAEKMSDLLPRTCFKDPALVRVIERRNWATTKFLKAVADGAFPKDAELRRFVAAYDEAEMAIEQTHLDVTDDVQDRAAVLASMRLPMRRALCLDRVELVAYLDDEDLVVKSIAKLKEVGDCKSARAFQLALESMPGKARDALWAYDEWKNLMGELNEQVAKRADNYAKE